MEQRIKRGVLFIPIAIGGVFLMGLLVMWLWNTILPETIGVKSISYFQAMGIFVLSKLLFGFNKGWGRRDHYRQRVEEKWHTMTPEEREKLKSEWKHRCGSRWSRFDKTEEPTTTPGINEKL